MKNGGMHPGETFTVTRAGASPIMRSNHRPLNHFLWIKTPCKSLCFLKESINQFLLVMFSLSTAICSLLIKSWQIISLGFIAPKLSFFHPPGHGRAGNAWLGERNNHSLTSDLEGVSVESSHGVFLPRTL